MSVIDYPKFDGQVRAIQETIEFAADCGILNLDLGPVKVVNPTTYKVGLVLELLIYLNVGSTEKEQADLAGLAKITDLTLDMVIKATPKGEYAMLAVAVDYVNSLELWN